jgi:hypothetical protein
MITPAILFDIPPTLSTIAQAFLCELRNCFHRSHLLHPLSRIFVAAILLNIPPLLSAFPQTFLCELQNRFDRPLLLDLLIALFSADIPIIILLARLSLVPCILMHNTNFKAAHNTLENVPINAIFMDLAGSAASAAAPPEVRVIVEGVEGRESIKSSILSKSVIAKTQFPGRHSYFA